MNDIPAVEELLNFTGKVVLITGASSGIGTGIALRFGEAGAMVAVHYRSGEEAAIAVLDQIKGMGGEAVLVQADITNRDDVDNMIATVVDKLGRLDVLINNAGIYPLHRLLDMTDEQWDSVIAIDLKSVFLCTQIAAQQMKKQDGQGAIVNICSIEGENPAPSHSHYNAAKGGVLMYTRAAALELGPHIRVNSVSPGLIWKEGLDKDWPDGVIRYRRSAPLKRLGKPDDVADACLFLSSPAARWITGVNLRVDGGVITNPGY